MTSKRPYMPLYIADYESDTRHLTAEEDGVYGRLLRAMWTAGGQLPRDDERLAQIARISLWRWRKLAAAILPYFIMAGEHIEQKRINIELRKLATLSDKRKAAGKQGGRPKSEPGDSRNLERTPSVRSVAPGETSKENKPDENQLVSTPRARPRDARPRLETSDFRQENPSGFSLTPPDENPAAPAIPKKLNVRQTLETKLSPRIARAVIDHRVALRKPLTPLAAERLVAKLAESPTIAGVSADEAAAQMIDHGWRGFDPEWLINAQTRTHESTGPPARQSREDSDRAAWNKVLDDAAKGKHHG